MPSITSGSNATFTVPSGYVIDIQCPSGWVQLECPVGTRVFEGNPAGQTFGPYAASSAKLTSVKGDIYYEVDPQAASSVSTATEYYGVSSQTLRKWRAAFARSKNGGAVARIACVGDSTVRGAWSNGTSGTNVVPKSWPTYLAKAFTAAGFKGNSESWFGGGNFGVALNTLDSRIGMTGGWVSTSGTQSLGGVMPTTNATGVLSFTPTIARTSYDIYYPRNFLGTLNMDIGGVGTTLIDESASNSVAKATITGSSSLSPLNLTWASGTVAIMGVEGKDPTDVVSVMNMGRSGSKVSDWTASTSSAWDSLSALPFVAPDLTIISLTINDWVAGTSVATYTANMQSLITAALQTGDVLLLTGAPSNTANASAAAQAAIVAAYYQLAATNGVPLLDISNRFTSYAVSQPLGLYGDTALHPGGVGYADIAACITKALTV